MCFPWIALRFWGEIHKMKKNNKTLWSMVVKSTDAAIWRWRRPAVIHYCFGPIFGEIFVTMDCATGMFEGLGSNQLCTALNTVVKCSKLLSRSTAELNLPSVGIVAMANTSEEVTELQRRQNVKSGAKKTHLMTSESKACDLVSPFSLGCGLAKSPPCTWRGDEPQPHRRTC